MDPVDKIGDWADAVEEEEEEKKKSLENAKNEKKKEEDKETDANLKEVEKKIGELSTKGIDSDDPVKLKTHDGLLPISGEVEVDTSSSHPDTPISSVGAFEDLGLSEGLLKGVYGMGFVKPSKIQETALPIIMREPTQNLIAQSQSGTGKTAAFTLGMLSKVDPSIHKPQALCLCHARELATQIFKVVSQMGQYSSIEPFLVVPDSVPPRGTVLTNQVIIGTPGKILDLSKKKNLNLKGIKVLVLDEADYMVGALQKQTIRIKNQLPATAQILLFSATYSAKTTTFARRIVPKPFVELRLKREELTLEPITQMWINCNSQENKYNILTEIYTYISVGSSIIFVNTRGEGDKLKARMTKEGYTMSLLHGGIPPKKRDIIMEQFRAGKTRILVTTNVLSRGIDMLQISLVINYDLPIEMEDRGKGNRYRGNNKWGKISPDYDTYVHRIGRTGRWLRPGIAINFVHDSTSKSLVDDMQTFFGRPIEELKEDQIPDLDDKLKEMGVYT